MKETNFTNLRSIRYGLVQRYSTFLPAGPVTYD
ncbi:hypothetical protein TNCV_4792431, partial [Trichonephila clavipes]